MLRNLVRDARSYGGVTSRFELISPTVYVCVMCVMCVCVSVCVCVCLCTQQHWHAGSDRDFCKCDYSRRSSRKKWFWSISFQIIKQFVKFFSNRKTTIIYHQATSCKHRAVDRSWCTSVVVGRSCGWISSRKVPQTYIGRFANGFKSCPIGHPPPNSLRMAKQR